MVVYYRGSGLIADVALLLNILLIAGGLAGFQATLTLPGIAGIILTIGMAVDANVLIFERIREELNIGKTPRAAVDSGYDRATLTILDANVTTLIAALVLFQFGTGPVKGFAVTLSLGVIASLFTALILTRMVFDYYLMKRKTKHLSI
jgi:preprotein translocase subunit SecD